jgi:hypothetical protein
MREALPNYTPPMKSLLNEYMRRHRHASEAELQGLTAHFEQAVSPVVTLFGDVPFRRFYRRPDGRVASDRSINRAVFDVQMLVMEGLNPDWARDRKDHLTAAFRNLCLEDRTFADAVSRATADKTRIEYRLRRWKEALVALGAELPAISRLP